MSQSFSGRGLDEIPLEAIEKRGIKYQTPFIRSKYIPPFSTVCCQVKNMLGCSFRRTCKLFLKSFNLLIYLMMKSQNVLIVNCNQKTKTEQYLKMK